MTQERVTRIDTPRDGVQTHTTIITDEPRRSGGVSWLLMLVILVLAALAFVVVNQMSGAEVAKDNAIADAAGSVGTAAGQVGDAAQDAARSIGS